MLFLGTGAAEMIPDPFCRCPICADARKNPAHVRLRSMLLLDEKNLIDFGPDLGAACAKYALDLTGLERIFVTHTHQDHFCMANAGLVHMSRTRKEPLDVYLSEGAYHSLEAVFASGGQINAGIGKAAEHLARDLRFHIVPIGQPIRAGAYTVTAVETTHRVTERENAVNYLFETAAGRKLLYACDTGYYTPQALRILRGKQIDILVMDATFGSNPDANTASHLNAWAFRDMLGILTEHGIIGPQTRVFANHINHKHTFTHEDYQRWFDENAAQKVTVTHDGLRIGWDGAQ